MVVASATGVEGGLGATDGDAVAVGELGGVGRLAESLPGLLDTLGVASTTATGAGEERFKGLVFDATGLTDTEQRYRQRYVDLVAKLTA